MTFLATAEGLVLGTRAGLDPAAMNAVLNESTGGSWITKNHIEPRILSRTFDDPFRLELMLKDVAIATQLSRDLGLPLPFVALCESLYRAADREAGPGRSISELVRWVEHLTGVEITPGGDGDVGIQRRAGARGDQVVTCRRCARGAQRACRDRPNDS